MRNTPKIQSVCEEWTIDLDVSAGTGEFDCKAAGAVPPLMDIFHRRDRAGRLPVLAYFHGGGLSSGDHHEIPEIFKLLGCVIVSCGYRLYPQAHFPDFINDAALSLAWIKRHITEFGGNPDAVFVSGHSAGAYLAATIAAFPEYLEKFCLRPHDFTGFISISGTMVTHFAVQQELYGTQDSIIVDRTALLNRASADIPPMLIITGETGLDISSRPADNKLMAEAMRCAGHSRLRHYEIPGADHQSIIDASFVHIGNFIDSLLPGNSGSREK